MFGLDSFMGYLEDEGDEFIGHRGGDHLGLNLHNCDNKDIRAGSFETISEKDLMTKRG